MNNKPEYILFDKLGLNAPKYKNGSEESLEELKLKMGAKAGEALSKAAEELGK